MNKVFITGSSKGLGKSLAEKFLEKGDKVIGFSRSCTIQHENYQHIKIDLSQLKEVEKIDFKLDEKSYHKVILINNAGTLGEVGYLGQLSAQNIKDAFAVNTLAPFLLYSQFLAAECNEVTEKFVLNIGTGAATNPLDGWSIYCSSKAALNMLTKVAVQEIKIKKRNIKVVTLAPGIVDTEMQSEIRSADQEEFSNVSTFKNYKENNQLNSPAEVAEKILLNFDEIFSKGEAIQSIRDYD